jgi:hypothetical protein
MIRTLDDARAFVRRQAERLDPLSRYIPELLAIVDASKDVGDLERRLLAASRGLAWAGEETFRRMTLEERLAVNLITNETSLMRFETAEIAFLRRRILPFLRTTPGRILSLPCSHGEEAVSLAIECAEAGIPDFLVQGYDIQPACIETARSGRIPLSGMAGYVTGVVDPALLRHLRFDVADVFRDAIPAAWDLVVCRNFLGYFKPDSAREVLLKLGAVLAERAFLMLDAFILRKHPEILEGLPLSPFDGLPFFARGI